MEPPKLTTAQPSSNPPSVEIAYKRKSIALKRRLNEIEAENELMRVRNKRGWKYIQKMRLESCMLLERLAKVTGMAEETQAGANAELRARATAIMSDTTALNGDTGSGGGGYLEDETEGSSEERPPTPQERPLRVKRPRKSNVNNEAADDEASIPPAGNVNNNNVTTTAANITAAPSATAANSTSSMNNVPDSSRFFPPTTLPRLAPAPSQEEMTSSFRIQTGSNGNGSVTHERDMCRATSPAAANAFVYQRNDRHGSQSPYPPFHTGLGQVRQSAPGPSATSTDIDSEIPKEEN